MKVTLNKKAIDHARMLISHHEVDTNAKSWAECKPTINDIDRYLEGHNMEEYGQWFLGINASVPANNKDHYMYPNGDLKIVHVSALIQSRDQAEKAGHKEIADAAKELLQHIEKVMGKNK